MLPALAFAADVLLYRWLLSKSLWRAALVFPSFWVACEFLSEINSPHGTAGNLAYTQMDFLPILQIASTTGIWAISFCVFLFAATAAIIIGNRAPALIAESLPQQCLSRSWQFSALESGGFTLGLHPNTP